MVLRLQLAGVRGVSVHRLQPDPKPTAGSVSDIGDQEISALGHDKYSFQ